MELNSSFEPNFHGDKKSKIFNSKFKIQNLIFCLFHTYENQAQMLRWHGWDLNFMISIVSTKKTILIYVWKAVHRGAICQFPCQWIYYCNISKFTGKETDKTHRCNAVVYQISRFLNKTAFIGVLNHISFVDY